MMVGLALAVIKCVAGELAAVCQQIVATGFYGINAQGLAGCPDNRQLLVHIVILIRH